MLVHYAADLPPGAALDVGSGKGADVLWLASRGWDVTGVDVSPVALARSAQHAEQAGPQITARTTWAQADLLTFAPPADSYDLVSAQFMHLPGPARSRCTGGSPQLSAPAGPCPWSCTPDTPTSRRTCSPPVSRWPPCSTPRTGPSGSAPPNGP